MVCQVKERDSLLSGHVGLITHLIYESVTPVQIGSGAKVQISCVQITDCEKRPLLFLEEDVSGGERFRWARCKLKSESLSMVSSTRAFVALNKVVLPLCICVIIYSERLYQVHFCAIAQAACKKNTHKHLTLCGAIALCAADRQWPTMRTATPLLRRASKDGLLFAQIFLFQATCSAENLFWLLAI